MRKHGRYFTKYLKSLYVNVNKNFFGSKIDLSYQPHFYASVTIVQQELKTKNRISKEKLKVRNTQNLFFNQSAQLYNLDQSGYEKNIRPCNLETLTFSACIIKI